MESERLPGATARPKADARRGGAPCMFCFCVLLLCSASSSFFILHSSYFILQLHSSTSFFTLHSSLFIRLLHSSTSSVTLYSTLLCFILLLRCVLLIRFGVSCCLCSYLV